MDTATAPASSGRSSSAASRARSPGRRGRQRPAQQSWSSQGGTGQRQPSGQGRGPPGTADHIPASPVAAPTARPPNRFFFFLRKKKKNIYLFIGLHMLILVIIAKLLSGANLRAIGFL